MPAPAPEPAFATAHIHANALICGRMGSLRVGPVSFSLRAGEGLCVSGPNGCGKTTLLRTLAGLLPLWGGALDITGPVHFIPAGSTPQSLGPASIFARTLALLFSASDLSGYDPFDIKTLKDRAVPTLSAGQRQRLKLHVLTLADRPVWLLDEPTDALDAQGQAALAAEVSAHRARGGCVVIATHDPHAWPDFAHLSIGGNACVPS